MHCKKDITLEKVAELINAKVESNYDFVINDITEPETADKNCIIYFANKRYTERINSSHAIVVLTSSELASLLNKDKIALITNNLQLSFIKLLEIFEDKDFFKPIVSQSANLNKNVKISENAVIHDYVTINENSKIGNNTIIYPHVYLGKNVEIGENCIIYPQVTVYNDTKIGNNVIIHAGAVIGCDGFGYSQIDRKNIKIPQIGNVVIGDNVEIGANTTIARSTIGSTLIKDGVKIDNLVQISHNVEIGDNSIIAALTGISGSTKIGKNCILLGQVGVADHATIEDNIIVGAKTGVPSRVVKSEEKMIFGAIPAKPILKAKRIEAVISKLPEFYQEFQELKKKFAKQ